MPVRTVTRFLMAWAAMAATATIAELWRVWPDQGAGGGFAGTILLQVAGLTALWTLPAAGLCVGAGKLVGLLGRRRPTCSEPDQRPRRDWSRLVLVPPAVFACVSVGQWLHAWSARAFVRQDLAGAAVPAIELLAYAALAGAFAGLHVWQRDRLRRLPGWAIAAATGGGALLFGAVHLARFPQLLDSPLAAPGLQLALVAAAGATALSLPARWVPFRPGLLGLAVGVGASVTLLLLMMFGGRLAPLSYPVATAALQSRGLVAARAAALLGGLGDGDGDGFSRYFGGLDCDDGDPKINPLAHDVPGNGVDEDCFEGDLTAAAVERDRAARAAARARPTTARARNLLLISVDALRADAVGFDGAERPSSPNLDQQAARGAVFTRAYSQAPMTRKSFPSLLSGRYPSNIHWLDLKTQYPYPVSHADNLFLAEAVQAAGIRTGSVVAFSYARNSRFDQGFDERIVHPASHFKNEINADRIVNDAITLVQKWNTQGDRFFLWLHFYEAHFPYYEHPEAGFGGGERERYLSEVQSIDRQLSRLFEELRRLGLADNTALIFTGDHGEEFGEHGGQFHGDLYVEDLHVPLLIAGGGLPAVRYDSPVELIDVAPTALELLGVPIPDDMDGVSLVPAAQSDPGVQVRPAFAELLPDRKVPRRVVTVIDTRWQLIVDFQLGARELFDLQTDPTAQNNVLTEAPEQARRLEQLLRRQLALRMGPVRLSATGAR